MSVADLLKEALEPPPEERAGLVDRIVESLSADLDSGLEDSHLEEVVRRQQQKGPLLDGDEVLQRGRDLLQR